MDCSSVWSDAIKKVSSAYQHDSNQAALIQLFETQVFLVIDDSKIRFLCNSPFVYKVFIQYATEFYDAVKEITGRSGLGFAAEFGTSHDVPAPKNEPAVVQENNIRPEMQTGNTSGTASDTAQPENEPRKTVPKPRLMRENNIDPNKTFENYVTDPDNRMLYASALAVASNPGAQSYNPFYIYGASGLGKTHLLFAIANRIRSTRPDVSLIYTRAEAFIRHYVESMSKIKKEPFSDQQVHFQDLYTEHDVFIVDDIQNFIKGPKARDAFFDIIAEFLDKPNRQLILVSDVPPGNLNGFGPRLTSRFGSGVCCEVVPPSAETREAIALTKCHEIGVDLPRDVIEYIATHIRSNVREIEGAIKTLNTHIIVDGKITLEGAVKILNNLVHAPNQFISVDKINERVAEEYEVTVEAMESAEKKKAVSAARSMCMLLCRDLISTLSLNDIARAFNKDHSSAHEAIKRVRRQMEDNPQIASTYNKLMLSLKKD